MGLNLSIGEMWRVADLMTALSLWWVESAVAMLRSGAIGFPTLTLSLRTYLYLGVLEQ